MAKKSGFDGVDKIVNEVWPILKNEAEMIKKQESQQYRLGAMSTVLRDVFTSSSLCMYNGRAYIFGGKIYEPLRWEDVRNAIFELMRLCELNYADLSHYLQVSVPCIDIIKSKALVVDPELVVFENCVLNIAKNKVMKHSKNHKQVSMSHFNYNPTAECKRWDKFLDQVLPNTKTQDCLQEYLGSIFINRKQAKLEQMLILKGSGSNGKGVVFETITGIVGHENVTNFGLDAILTGSDVKKNVAMMNGKRLNYCSEIQALASAKYTDRLKAIISGEPMEARALYGENFMAHDLPLLMANANKLPNLDDVSYGMQRRIMIIEFNHIVPIEFQDHLLSKKLAAEYSGIFNWLMEGRERLIKRDYKFTSSAEMRLAAAEFSAQSSSTLAYMLGKNYRPIYDSIEHIVPTNIRADVLYQDYGNWCVKNKMRIKTYVEFTKDLRSAGYIKHRSSKGLTFEIYGEGAFVDQKQHEEDMERFYAERTQRSHRPFFENGKMFAKGDFNAAFYAHVSRPWLSTMRIKGQLDGTFTYQVATPVYDIDKLVKRCDELNAYMSDEEKQQMFVEREGERQEIEEFNNKMKILGKPYRKAVWGLQKFTSHDFIIVPNEWEYSEENEKTFIEERSKELINKM